MQLSQLKIYSTHRCTHLDIIFAICPTKNVEETVAASLDAYDDTK